MESLFFSSSLVRCQHAAPCLSPRPIRVFDSFPRSFSIPFFIYIYFSITLFTSLHYSFRLSSAFGNPSYLKDFFAVFKIVSWLNSKPMTVMEMECMELDCSSSSSCCPDSESSSDQAVTVSSKRKAGRKKFKETRHPVFRGVRQRKGNKWVCEVREPYKKSRIWLGTFTSPEMAARAYDVAALALRGKSAALNFPDSASILPRAKSSSPKDIQTAALAAAEAFRPRPTTTTCSPPSLSLETISSPSTSSTSYIPNEKNQEKKALDHTHESLETQPNQSNVPLFIDEEALFNLPGLLDSMAEGMLIAPPAMHRQADWDDEAVTINIDLWVD